MGASYGKTRSEQEKNLRKEGMHGMSDERYDKCKYLEKKYGKGFYSQDHMDSLK